MAAAANKESIFESEQGLPADNIIGIGTARAPGSCGDLVLSKKDRFSIPCSINRFVDATVTLYEGNGAHIYGPQNRRRALRAVRETLSYSNKSEFSARVHIDNDIPRGMASSAASVVAAIGATVKALGREGLSPAEVAFLASKVGVKDAIMFPELTRLRFNRGELSCEELGPPPSIDVLALVFWGKIGRRNNRSPSRDAIDNALYFIRTGAVRDKPSLVGSGATMSTKAQQYCDPETVRPVFSFAERIGAIGVTAPKGSVIGILLSKNSLPPTEALVKARDAFPIIKVGYCLKIIKGGVRFKEDDLGEDSPA
ncbi:MAG: hypothetical protein PHE48_00530 [Candidatus Daviesbacteria bacterium]|nr:hypothetical protein [Candidatus Daviesbacteria bacterium]